MIGGNHALLGSINIGVVFKKLEWFGPMTPSRMKMLKAIIDQHLRNEG